MTAKKAATPAKKSAAPAKKPAATPAKKVVVEKPVQVAVEPMPEAAAISEPVVQSAPDVVDESAVEDTVEELVKDIFMIAKKECSKCVHLCPETGSLEPTSCHYDNGNEDCPARTTVIMIGMSLREIETAATAIVEATENGDFQRLNRAANRLATKSESVRTKISKRVLELQAEHANAVKAAA